MLNIQVYSLPITFCLLSPPYNYCQRSRRSTCIFRSWVFMRPLLLVLSYLVTLLLNQTSLTSSQSPSCSSCSIDCPIHISIPTDHHTYQWWNCWLPTALLPINVKKKLLSYYQFTPSDISELILKKNMRKQYLCCINNLVQWINYVPIHHHDLSIYNFFTSCLSTSNLLLSAIDIFFLEYQWGGVIEDLSHTLLVISHDTQSLELCFICWSQSHWLKYLRHTLTSNYIMQFCFL